VEPTLAYFARGELSLPVDIRRSQCGIEQLLDVQKVTTATGPAYNAV
jgi:hypothetical protein